jgi:hypothetical protein
VLSYVLSNVYLQAVAIEKAASQLSARFSVLPCCIEEPELSWISSSKFIDPIPFEGDMQDWLSIVWKNHLKHGNESAFVGRTVLVRGSNKRFLQPGLLSFEPVQKHLKIQWFQSEKNGQVFPAHLQMEFIEKVKSLPPYNDDQLTCSPYLFSKSLWQNGTFRMLKPSLFQKLVQSDNKSPAKSPLVKSQPKPAQVSNTNPKKAAKAIPPETSSSKALNFPPSSPKNKRSQPSDEDTETAIKKKTKEDTESLSKPSDEPTAAATKTKPSRTTPGVVAWKYYQCHYTTKGYRCTNEAMWCEKENSKAPKYCSVVKRHQLETATYFFWDLKGRGGFPKSDSPMETDQNTDVHGKVEEMGEVDAEIDMDSASESESEH